MTYAKASMESRERKFATLVSTGWTYTDAYRQVFTKRKNWTPEALRVAACRFAKRGNVMLTVRAFVDAARISSMDSVGRFLADLLADYEAAKEAGNHTAVAALQRIRAQVHGLLRDHLVLHPADELDDEALIQRIAGGDAYVAGFIRRRIGRAGFDA